MKNRLMVIHTAVTALAVTAVFSSPAAAQQALRAPSSSGQLGLIRNTLTALSHANISGNYTVLRDLGSDRFRQSHKPADLAAIFKNLRDRNVNLGAVLTANPSHAKPPQIDAFRGRMLLEGGFPTKTQTINYAITFQHTPKGWMIDDLSVALQPKGGQPVAQRQPAQAPARVAQRAVARQPVNQQPAARQPAAGQQAALHGPYPMVRPAAYNQPVPR